MSAYAMVVALLAPTAGAHADTWRLIDVIVHVRIGSDAVQDGRVSWRLTRRADAQGGEIEATLRGDILGACPGGSETVRFTWSFATPVTTVQSGQEVAVDGTASSTRTAPCRGGLADRSYAAFGGNDGGVHPGIPALRADWGSFAAPGEARRFAMGPGFADDCCGRGAVTIGTGDVPPDRNRGWFGVAVLLGATTELVVLYVFERGAVGAAPGSATAPPQPPTPTPATGPCASWNVSGRWTTQQGNGYHPTFDLVQRGREVTGTATLPDAERLRAGFSSATGRVAGSIRGDQLALVVTWERPGGPTRGRYEATVTASALERGRTLPADVPGAAGAGWSGSGRAACAR